eukprot:gene6519-7263_t
MFSGKTQYHQPCYGTPGFQGPSQTSYNDAGSTRSMQPMVTGASVLGVKFNGGVVIAADMLGSYGSLARFPGISRIAKINDNTIIGASGDYADFQHLTKILDSMMRSKFNPLWNTVIVAGYKNGKSLLGYVDKIGTAYQDDTLATGYGAYIARPMLRDALEKNPQISQDEAVNLITDCLRVLYYRDARSLNKVEIAVVTEDGVQVRSNVSIDSNWEIAHMIK